MVDKREYMQGTKAKMAMMVITIEKVRSTLKSRVANGVLKFDGDLEKSAIQVDAQMGEVKIHYARLAEADESNWLHAKVELEHAWEDLTQAIKHMISRMS